MLEGGGEAVGGGSVVAREELGFVALGLGSSASEAESVAWAAAVVGELVPGASGEASRSSGPGRTSKRTGPERATSCGSVARRGSRGA